MNARSEEYILIFICNNFKSTSKCCANANAEILFESLRRFINQKINEFDYKTKIKVVKTGCLGRCAAGPNLFIAPDNIWYTYSNVEDALNMISLYIFEKLGYI